MPRRPRTLRDAAQLQQLSKLFSSSIATIIEAWSEEDGEQQDGAHKDSASNKESNELPSWKLYEAQKLLLGVVGKVTEIVSEPNSRLLEVSSQYNESRSLFIAAERKVADLLASAPGGLPIAVLGTQTGIEPNKLSRIMRCLDSIGIFREVRPDVFANNRISAELASNEPLRAYIMLFGLDLYTASDRLPRALLDPVKGPSYDVAETAWQDAVDTTLPRWDWLEQRVPEKQLQDVGKGYPGYAGQSSSIEVGEASELMRRPEHGVFGLAMVGGGRVFGVAHLYDYPWHLLGNATVVDCGGGVGGFALQLSKLYPDLKFVVQDRGPTIEMAQSQVWPSENPAALRENRVTFMKHDFFEKNPVEGADIYWLRYILHDWSDEYCVKILIGLRKSMTSTSRVLIADQVMNTTLGSAELESAPAPLPANYGYHIRYSHQRDLAMMAIINGIERTPNQFREIVERAGLAVRKIWTCRSQVSLVEVTLP